MDSNRKRLYRLCSALACALILVGGFASTARSDNVGVLCHGSKAGSFEVKALQLPRGGPCTGFVVTDAGREIARATNAFWGSGRLMLSADGRRVVFVQDYFYGMLLPGGKLVQYGRKPAWAVPGRDALVFFRDGKKLASYPLEGLLKRTRLVDLSSSHIDWIANWETFRRPLKRTLELVTTSFRRYRFDTTSGKQLSRGDTKAWTDCPFIAYGKVWHSKHGWEMSPAYSVKGNTPSRVWPLETRLPKPLTRSHQTLCLSKARGIWTATRVLRTLNGASLRR